jgi:hypothetical protein
MLRADSKLWALAFAASGVALAQSPPPSSSKATHRLEVAPLAGYGRLDGTEIENQSRGTLLSKLNFGLQLAYEGSENGFESFAALGLLRSRWDSVSGRTLSTDAFNHLDLEGGTRWAIGGEWRTSLYLGITQELFYRAPSSEGLRLETVLLQKAGLELDGALGHFAGARWDLTLRAGALFSGLLDEYGAGLGLTHRTRLRARAELSPTSWWSLSFALGQSFQSNDLLHLRRSDLGVACGLGWSL